MVQRNYVLHDDSYYGTVAGVFVSYNYATESRLRDLQELEGKRFLEDAAVSAALRNGYTRVYIRSMPHATTINAGGETVRSDLHATVDFGENRRTAHIVCHDLDITAGNYYVSMTHGEVKWADRATSSNEGSGPSQEGSASGSQSGVQSNQSNIIGQWVATNSGTPGQEWAWWDGQRYTGQYR